MLGVQLHVADSAFVWSIILIAGTCMASLRYVFNKNTSVATDMGHEACFCEVPTILYTFMVRMAGVDIEICLALVDPDPRLF